MSRVIAIIALLVSSSVEASQPVLSEGLDSQSVGEFVRYWEEREPGGQGGDAPQDEVLLEEIVEHGAELGWVESNGQMPSLGFRKSPFWFHLDMEYAGEGDGEGILELAYAPLGRVDVYMVRDGQVISEYHTGAASRFSTRAIEHRHFLFPILLREGEKTDVYLRIETESSVQLPLTLWHVDSFWVREQMTLFGHGIYLGILLVMVLYNLFVYFSLRERSYVPYVVCVLSFAVLCATVYGYGFQHLWPLYPRLNQVMMCVSTAAGSLASLIFAVWFLRLDRRFPRLSSAMLGLGALLLVTGLVCVVLPYRVVAPFVISLGGITALTCLGVGLFAWAKKSELAGYYVWAWFACLLGILLLVGNKLGYVSRTPVTEYGAQIGFAVQVLLLSFALGMRIRAIREQAQEEEFQSASLQQQMSLETEADFDIFSGYSAELGPSLDAIGDKLSGYRQEVNLLSDLTSNLFDDEDEDERLAAEEIFRSVFGQLRSLHGMTHSLASVGKLVDHMRGVGGAEVDGDARSSIGLIVERSVERLELSAPPVAFQNVELKVPERDDATDPRVVVNAHLLSEIVYALLEDCWGRALESWDPWVWVEWGSHGNRTVLKISATMEEEAVGMEDVVSGLDILMEPREGSIAMERGSGETPWFAYVLDLACYDMSVEMGMPAAGLSSEVS